MKAPDKGGRREWPVGQVKTVSREPADKAASVSRKSLQLRHSLLLFVLGSAWGLQFTLLKITADSDLDELSVLTLAMLLLALAYLVVMACGRAWFRPTLRHVWFFSISALFGFVVPLCAVMLVAEQLSAGLIVFFESLTPVLTVVLVLLVGTERLNAARLIAVACGLFAVLLVLWPDLMRPGSARLESLLLALIIPFAFAVDAVYVAARWPSDLRAFQVVTGEAVMAVIIFLPFCLWQALQSPGYLTSLTDPWIAQAWGWGHWSVLIFSAVCFLEGYLYFYLLKNAGAVFVSIASFLSLFAGILWGMLLLGERHPTSVWLAVLLASLALYLVNFRAGETQQRDEEEHADGSAVLEQTQPRRTG